jgi:hypothetical protein
VPSDATAVRLLIARQVPEAVLGVPMPMLTAALGSIFVMLTLMPPICCTENGCEFDPSWSSVPVNVSVTVGATGVGAAGSTGSLHAHAKTATTTTDATKDRRLISGSIIPTYCTVSVIGDV